MMEMLRWILRIHLLAALLILFAVHGLLYFGLGNENWFVLALSASLVWTVAIAFVQLYVRSRMGSK